jgi:DNA-binding transcriptional ArsR family regulator
MEFREVCIEVGGASVQTEAELIASGEDSMRTLRQETMGMSPSLDGEILGLLSEQVTFHREQRLRHAARMESASRRLERAPAAVSARADLSREVLFDLAAPAVPPKLSRIIAGVVEAWPSGSPFGATQVAAEISRQLGREVTPREVSVKLRRLRDRGAIRAVREGQSHVESLFEKR